MYSDYNEHLCFQSIIILYFMHFHISEVLSSEDDKSSKKPGKSAEPVSQLIQLTPKKGKKTKEELKQEIREQKVRIKALY